MAALDLIFSSEETVTANGKFSILLTNTGSGTLKAVSPGIAIPANFTKVAGSGTPADCSASISLAPGASCNISVEFTRSAKTAATVKGATLAATATSLTSSAPTVKTVTALGTTAEPAGTATVVIAEATGGATVYYATNGATPTTASTVYKGPIAVTATTTVKFIAVAPGYNPSPVRTIVVTVE